MSEAHAAIEPKTISLIALADRFMEVHRTMRNRAFAFVLGAGASRTSGIKRADEMVADWVRMLHREAVHDAEGDGADWATAETLKIGKYDPKDPAASYSALYWRMYRDDPDRGYAYLEDQMRNAEPSYGYSVLARIMEEHQHKVVVTTNFDNLVADSLSIFSKTYPLVCGHESLAGFISARVRRPVVVKVHRDLLLAPRSTPEDLADLPEGFTKALTELFRHYTPIVIGYGGNDLSLMKFLTGLPPKSVPGGVYWCYWEGGPAPSANIKQFVAEQRGSLVPIPGFDEAMMLIGNRLEFDVPDKFVRDRAEARAKRIVEQAQELADRLGKKKPQPALNAAANGQTPRAKPGHKAAPATGSTRKPPEAKHGDDADSALSGELSKAVQTTMQRTSGSLRWWQWQQRVDAEPDPAKRDKIYQDAIAALPDSAELHGNYALFLKNTRKDHDKAEEHFKRALAALPDDADFLGNYANFLTGIRKNNERAEEFFKRALAAQPNDSNKLANYASFLLSQERTGEGLNMLARAISALDRSSPVARNAEVWMYAVCHWLPDHWQEALGTLKHLLLVDKITTGEWDFSGVIAAAKKRGHPEAQWLEPLANVCAGAAPPSTLDKWGAWTSA